MKTFKSVIMVKHQKDVVIRAVRDRLPEMVPYLDDVKSITQEYREEQDGLLKLTNIWQADIALPVKVQNLINVESLKWTDRAEWISASDECLWTIEPHFFKDRVLCSGSTRFEPAIGGRGTRITFAGELNIDTKNIPGVPAFMEGAVTNTIETLITTVIPKNFRKITEALEILLKQ
jgi:hypothetical protein